MGMVRVNFHLTDKQLAILRARAKGSGLTVAELIRRAIDKFLNRKE